MGKFPNISISLACLYWALIFFKVGLFSVEVDFTSEKRDMQQPKKQKSLVVTSVLIIVACLVPL